MRSSFEEGKSAGYLGIGCGKNPYRKGDRVAMRTVMPALDEYASDWDSGYVAGERLARADLMDKRLSSTR